MLKVEHSIDYLKKGRSSSETFEGAQHVKQITSQRKTLRFKRSDDNPELPENFKVGQAIGGGDCFFDSVAKGLKQLKPEMDFTVKSLREVCKRFAQSQLENDQSWLKGALRNEAEPISVYVPRIEFTADDIEQKSGSVNVLELTSPIWGRSEIEGRIICKEYNVKLHVVEKHVVEGKEVWLDQIVNSEGSRSMDSIDYNEENTIHIINRGNAHFEPILSTQEIQHNKRQSPDPSDYDDEITPEVELINIIKSRDSEEEKLTKIRKLFEKEPKPDINFQGEDKDTPLHIAIRKKELKVIEWLVKNGAKIDIKNSRGRTQLEVAQHLERQDIVEVLKSHIQPNLQVSVERPSTQQKRTRTNSEEGKLENSNPKKQKTSSPGGQSMEVDQDTSSKKRPHEDEENAVQGKRPKFSTSNNSQQSSDIHSGVSQAQSESLSLEQYETSGHSGGLKASTHGDIYQLKLLMLFLYRGLKHRYKFKLATEIKGVGAFDDVYFIHDDKLTCLQAKHKFNEDEKITYTEIFPPRKRDKTDGEFAIQKYFISYLEAELTAQNEHKKLEHFIICTNIGFNFKQEGDKTFLQETNGNNKLFFDKVNDDLEESTKSKPIEENRVLKEIVSVKSKKEESKVSKFYKLNINDEIIKNILTINKESIKGECKSQLEKYEEHLTQKITDLPEYKSSSNNQEIEKKKNELLEGSKKDFLKKLVFAVNQPGEEELGESIKEELGEKFSLTDADLLYDNFQVKMLDWFKALKKEDVVYHTELSGEKFFKEAEERLSKLILIGPTLEYHAKIEEFGIAFSEEPSGLRGFLDHNERKIFNLVSPHKTILSSIKVCQTLKGIDKYQKDDSHIFVRLSSLLRIQNFVIQAFQSKTSNNLIVIECKSAEENVDQLYSQLSKVIKSNSNKKIILITQENDLLANKFKDNFSVGDEKNSLTDLTVESQEKLLKEGKVIFQGEEVSLGTLVDDGSKHLIDGEVLSKLINHEKIKVGKALIDSKYEDIKDYYIPRTFDHQVKIKEGLKEKDSEFLVTYNSQIDEQSLKKNQDIVLISATDNEFKELCNKYKERNIHWLKQEGDDLIWQQSYGALSKLRDFIDTNEQAIQEYKPEKITDIKDRVVIISAEPGMGKSTVLNPLALKTKDSLWVIRINLLDYSTELKRETEKKTKLNKAEAIKFLYRIVGFQLFQEQKEETTEKKEKREQTIEKVLSAITVKDSEIILDRKSTQDLDLLEIGLFNNFCNQGKIVLLFDGFDEISPDYTEKVIELLQVLKNSKVEKLWITTRPYNFVQEKLEDQLSVFSYLLKPLLPEEQKGFLRKFWKAKLKLSELDEQRSGVFIDELLDRLPGSISDKDFMSIPLHASMVAEVFKDAFKSFYDSNEQGLSDEHKREIEEQDLFTLYERFINIKFRKIRFGEKKPGMDIDDPDMKRIVEEEHKKFIEDHMKLALYEIFNKNEVEKLLSQEEIGKVTELIGEIKQGKERTGIIEQVIDSKPRFIHRTFAEYFASKLIYERLDYSKKSKQEIWGFFLDHILIDDRYNVIRRFIDCQLIDSKLFELKIGNTVEKLLEERIYKREITQLHVAAKEGLLETIKFLLNSLPNSDYINAKDNLGSTPLHYAVRNGHLEIIELLLERGGDVNAKTEMGFTPLHSAVEGLKIGCEKVVKLLLEKGADIHAETENGQTPLERLEGFKTYESFNKFYKDRKNSLIESNLLTVAKAVAMVSFYENEKVKEEYESRIFVPSEIILKSTRELFTIIISQKLDKEQKIKQFKDLIGKKGGVVGATYDGNTLLHFAAFKGYPEIIKEVIACAKQSNPDGLSNFINAEVNTLSNKATALHLAAFFGHEEVVQTLLKVDGININAKDSHGNTPIDLCYELRLLVGVDRNDHSEIINLIYNRDQNGDDINWELDEPSPPIDRAVNLFKECWKEAKSLVTDLKIQLDLDEALEQHPFSFNSFKEANSLVTDLSIKFDLEETLEQLLGKAHSNSYSNIIGSLIDHNADIDSNLEGISTIFEVGTCLGRRRRRNIDNCHFSWEDVDEFNEEKDEKRDLSKIKIDSEKFVSYIKDLPKGKQSQLIQLAGEVQVTGRFQGLVNKLTSNQKVISHLNRVGKISGMTMHGMMAKNVLADFLNGDYQGVAINVGFIAGGQGFAKVAEAASLKGLKLASEGKLLLGRSLRAASPFLARGTSAFVVYDLVNQVKAFKNGTEEALVGVVGDSIYLGVDAAEIGIEIVEAFEVLEGVSSVTGPIGAAIGAVVFIGTDVYMAVKKVDKIDQIIHLKKNERFIEGLRAFIGMQPENYIEELVEEKQLNDQLVKQGLEYLKQHNDVQKYVFPTKKIVCHQVINNKTVCVVPGTYDGICIKHGVKTFYTEECKPVVEMDSRVILDRKRTDIKWSRAKPDNPDGGQVFCLPQGDYEPAPSYGSYLCESAIGITDLSANKTGGYTLINLGEGEDNIRGFTDSRNIFVVNHGSKEYYGGNKDDIFVLQAGYVKGYLSGKGGVNTLDTTSFAFQEEPLNIQLDIGEIIDYLRDNWLRVCDINKVIGRENRAETITVSCNGCNSNVKLIDGQSGNKEIKDKINIIGNHCSYQMQIIVRPNTVIYNRALEGNFDYLVPLNDGGSAEFIFIYGPERFNVNNTFWFGYEPVNIKSIDVRCVNIFNRTKHEVKFNFIKSDKEFKVTIPYPENPSYRLGKNGEIKIGNKDNLYMLQSSNESSEEIIKNYLPLASRLNKMSFFIQSLLSNETVVIGSGSHEVIHNNPAYRSHLVGNGGENVYVIDSKTKEVIIHDVDEENSIDTIDLRNVVRKAKEVKVIKLENDLLLRAKVKEQAEYCTVRLKDGVERYNKTHVILENVLMRISFDNNEWSLKPQPLMFEKDKEIIVVTGQDVEEGNEIITPRKGGNYKFVRSNGNDLMITNAFDSSITKNDLCTITMSKFYEEPKMATLSIKFADKEVVLKEHQEEISSARDVNVVKKEYKDQVYNDVFNHTKSSPEVIMLSDQPMAHKHRHSRRRQQTRHHRSENITSNGTRPSSWINDLFSWVKSSVDGLFYSRAALPEETSNTASSIPQVDEQFAKASVSNSSSTSTTLPSDGTDKKQENGGFFRDNIDYVNANIKQMRERQTPVKFKPSGGNTILEMGDHYLSQVDFNGTIMLLDLLIRKVTGQKYISTVDQSISPLEAQGYALNITKGFERVVEQAGLKSDVSMHRLNIDYVRMQEEIAEKVMSGKFNEISGILNSYVEKACPGREVGCPGKLSPKKFDKFMIQFNSRLNIVLNQSIEQILHNRDGRLEVDDAKQMSLEPQSYLSNASVHSHSKVSTCLSEIGVTKLGVNLNR